MAASCDLHSMQSHRQVHIYINLCKCQSGVFDTVCRQRNTIRPAQWILCEGFKNEPTYYGYITVVGRVVQNILACVAASAQFVPCEKWLRCSPKILHIATIKQYNVTIHHTSPLFKSKSFNIFRTARNRTDSLRYTLRSYLLVLKSKKNDKHDFQSQKKCNGNTSLFALYMPVRRFCKISGP